MHPSSILSYYPSYAILDEIVQKGYNSLNIYIDLKNCLQTLYMEHAIVNIIENSISCGYSDTSIFTSLISFLTFHKIYSERRNININFYIFFESGQSYYHKNISNKYKISRRIDDLYGLSKEKRDLFFKILYKNFLLVEKACNKLPKIKVIRLDHLEADFIPYYLIRNKLVDHDDKTGNIVYSNDHDLMQTINAGNNVYIFKKTPKGKSIITKNDVMKLFFKSECDYPDNYLPLAMAITGDPGDDVYGVKGIGEKRMMGIMNEVINLVGGIDNLYKNVHEGNKILDLNKNKVPNKYINSIIKAENESNLISNNLKLVSFEILSRFLDDPVSTEMVEKRNYVFDILNNSNIKVPLESMKKALELNNVYLEEGSLETIYK